MLINRQIQSGSNSGFFIPFTAESDTPSTLFTGERLHTEFARRHIQLIETARLLKLLAMENLASTRSLQLADARMKTMCYSNFCSKGECKSLTIAYMRYLATLNTTDADKRLSSFLDKLSGYQDGKGKWSGFPFYYTLLMLSEVKHPQAADALIYAAKFFKHRPDQNELADQFSHRRMEIIHKLFTWS